MLHVTCALSAFVGGISMKTVTTISVIITIFMLVIGWFVSSNIFYFGLAICYPFTVMCFIVWRYTNESVNERNNK